MLVSPEDPDRSEPHSFQNELSNKSLPSQNMASRVDPSSTDQVKWQGLGKRHVISNEHTSPEAALIESSPTEKVRGHQQISMNTCSTTLVGFINRTVVPLLLVTLIPHLVIIMWYTVIYCQGSYLKMLSVLANRSIIGGVIEIWSHVHTPSLPILATLLMYVLYTLCMMKLLPGPTVYGPVTPKGNIPEYTDNGFKHYLLTMALFCLLTFLLRLLGLSPSIIYDRFDEVLVTLNIFSLIFCVFLYLKGQFSPSSTDSGSSGNIIFDYFWGMELYPKVLGVDVKLFTNCRFGMMVWALLVCVHVVKSYELHGFVDSIFVSAALQLLYITKFFWWESGYMHTIDIILDRAGFYICWGCLVYIPGMYTSVSFYLVSHPVTLGPLPAGIILLLGAFSIYINFSADRQKQEVRRTNGNCLIWGRKPQIIHTKYQLETGEFKENILLCSGWWGLSRHFHYVAEIILAFFWSVPALFHNLFPYSYLIFLIILLTHRSYRDDDKCRIKYGAAWTEYCKKVPYRIIPFIF